MTMLIKNFKKDAIRMAAETIKKGRLVVFPTETVYGLGANGLNANAIKKIFKVKGRPIDNPLIFHIANKKDITKLAKEIPLITKKLIDKFWPGPLTIVLKKSKLVLREATGGLNTVAIRMPSNKIALKLIKKANVPIVAPSANLSGKPSPTRLEHVMKDLNKKVDIIIDGGNTKIGIESTVIDLTTKIPTILRPGIITFEEIKKVVGTVRFLKKSVKSPGMKYKHYAPKARIILAEKKEIQKLVNQHKNQKVGIITTCKNNNYVSDNIKFVGKTPKTIAKNLFKLFREFDEEGTDVIIAEKIKEKGIGVAIMNRLKKAAGK